MIHEVYMHFLNGGPYDGDHAPNKEPFEKIILTETCEAHRNKPWEYEKTETCPNCKRHKYIRFYPEGFKEADCPGLEVITPDGIDNAPIIYRVDMKYEGRA
jgi:hypothetical protein